MLGILSGSLKQRWQVFFWWGQNKYKVRIELSAEAPRTDAVVEKVNESLREVPDDLELK